MDVHDVVEAGVDDSGVDRMTMICVMSMLTMMNIYIYG